MHKWDFWGWLAYAGLWIGAVILALDTALKSAPDLSKNMPSFANWNYFGFLPLLLLTISGLIFLARALGWIGGKALEAKRADPPSTGSTILSEVVPTVLADGQSQTVLPPGWVKPPKQILNQHYENETVSVDGKNFIDCTFKNVLFTYEGLAGIGFQNCKIGEPNTGQNVMLRSSNPIIIVTIDLLKNLRIIPVDAERRIISGDDR